MKQAPINEPAIDRLHKSVLPQISYSQCLSRYFATRSASIRSVELATASEFHDFIASCTLPARHGKAGNACNLALAGLQYEEALSRWFAICELLQIGARVPLYSTREAAAAARQQLLEVSVV